MISAILGTLGLCFVHVSCVLNYQQAFQLSRIGNISQFFELNNILMDGQRVGMRDVLPFVDTSGEQLYVGPGLAELAMPDECSERLTTVEIPQDVNDVNVLTWPTCTRIRRCGGCCANNMLKCMPYTVRPKPITILKARVWDSDQPAIQMDWEGAVQVEVDEHEGCYITCRITAEDCNARQRFDAFNCACQCRRTRNCLPVQRWDEESCSCVCKDPNRQCRDGNVFNPRTCRCQIDRNQTYSNLDVNENGEDLPNGHETSSTSSTSVSSSPSSTTTTTTTVAPTTTDPCASHFCPGLFTPNLNEYGNCVCTPPEIF